MNRNRMLVFAFVAIVLSGVVTYLTYRMLKARLAPAEETVTIVVAGDKLAIGSRITDQQVRLAPWPKAALPPGTFAATGDVVGRGVVDTMTSGEPVLDTKLASKEAGAGLTTVIPEGMRAVSVNVNDVVGVAGFVLPGTRVDVIAIGSPDKSGAEVAKVFLENVQVLTAGTNIEKDLNGRPQKVPVVTLLVSPEDAQKLALATVDSRIQLALRNPLDQEQANPTAARRGEIYGGPSVEPAPAVARPIPKARPRRIQPQTIAAKVAPPAAPPSRTYVVEVIRGDKRESTTFETKQAQPPGAKQE